MKVSNLITAPYYHVPVWMSILIDGLIKKGYILMLQHTHKDEAGIFHFRASYGEEKAREEILFVWNTNPERVYEYLHLHLGTDTALLVNMAEEYARERKGTEETKVYRGIIQLIIARITELFNATPNDTLANLNGDFSLVGRLPENGKLRINGRVERVEGSVGQVLEVANETCPELPRSVTAQRENNVWHIRKVKLRHEMPITGFYLR